MVSNSQPSPHGFPSQDFNNCNKQQCEGLVWLYYSDAFNQPQWGTINRNHFTYNERTVVCRQLGYEGSSGESGLPTRGPEDSRVWLTHVKCRDDDQLNILDCGGELCGSQTGCDKHEYDLVIKCGEL